MFHGPRTSSNISFLLRSSLELQKDIPWIDGLHQKTEEERKGKERKMMGLAVASMWEAALNKTTTTYNQQTGVCDFRTISHHLKLPHST